MAPDALTAPQVTKDDNASYRMRDFAIPAAITWLLALVAKVTQAQCGHILATLAAPDYVIPPEVWWCGLFFQAVICLLAPRRFMPHSRTALFIMAGYWICISANAIFLVLHHGTEIVR
jgi:hypothetical protein